MVCYLQNERRSIEPYVDGRNVPLHTENLPTDLPQKYVNLIPVISGSPVVFAVGPKVDRPGKQKTFSRNQLS